MGGKNGSAEIVGFEDAKARLRAPEIDPSNFLAVGPYLEAVRESQGLSLAAISERTHIKAVYLEAIEQMTLGELPSKAFAIGFVKGYAEALGLNAAAVVNRFKDEAGYNVRGGEEGGERRAAETAAKTARAASGQAGDAPRLSLAAAFAIVIFVLWCGYWLTRPNKEVVIHAPGVPIAVGAADGQAVVDPTADVPSAPPTAAPGAVPALPVIVEAAILERVEPVYPPTCGADAAPAESVTVAFTITPEGTVVSERVASTTNACFDRAALNAVKRWRFSPRTIDGAPRPAFEQQASFTFERP